MPYGSSPASLREVMQAQAMLEASRRSAGPGGARQQPTGRPGVSGDAMSEYYKSELEAQRSSRVGQQIQKYTLWPGMGLSMAARYPKKFKVEEGVERLAGMLGKTGGAKDAMMDSIIKAGGLGYMASMAPLNVMKQKRLAYERSMKPQLGKAGTAMSAFDTLSMANRMLAMPRVASMVYGGGMPGSLQGSLGMYGATTPMLKGAAGMAGMELPKALTTGAGAGMMNMLGPIALQMGLSMYKQKKIAKITAQRKSGGAEESKLSLSKNLDAQINLLSSRGMIQPGEQIRIQLLRWIEAHTSVMPELWAEQKYIREEKEKGTRGAGEAYEKGLGGGRLGGMMGVVDRAEAFTSKALAKYDVFGQIFNFLSTGKLPKQFQEDLEQAYSGMSGKERQEARQLAQSRGLSVESSRLLDMDSRRIVDMATSHEAKMIMLMSAQFDVQRFFATEIMTIRKAGFGIPDNLIKSDDSEKSGFAKMFSAITTPIRAIGNIPGLNALMNVAAMPFKMATGARNVAGNVWSGIRNFMTGGEDARRLLTSEEELRKEAGIYKSEQQMAYEYMGRGLPDIMEEMRFLGAVRAQLLTNIYHVVSAQLQATTGKPVQYDEKPFAEMTKKGVWSYTAGKYLDDKGLAEQQKQDQERMEIALERTFRGSGMDRIGWFMDMMGRDIASTTERWVGGIGGEEAVENLRGTRYGSWLLRRTERTAEQRMRQATERVRGIETLPLQLLEGGEDQGMVGRAGRLFLAGLLQNVGQGQEFTYTPEELVEAARFRQREMRGRGRARVVPGWMGAEQERAQMAFEQDIMPRVLRGAGTGVGGAVAGGAMLGLGGAASIASGGLLLPILAALAGGAGAGIIPQMGFEMKAMEDLYKGIEDFSPEKLRKIALGYAEMPDRVTTPENQEKVVAYYKKVNPEFAKRIEGDKAWWKNVNNFPFVMMALQGDSTNAFLETMETEGFSFTGSGFGATGAGEIGVRTLSDIYDALTSEDSPVPVKIVGIAKEMAADDGLGTLPIFFRKPQNAELLPGSGAADGYVFDLLSRLQATGEGVDAEGKRASGFQKGGIITKTGRILGHKGEIIVPPGGFGRSVQQELEEVEAKKAEKALHDKFDKMVQLLMDISENTEDSDDRGKGTKTGKQKKGGIFGSILGNLFDGLKGMFGTLAAVIMGRMTVGGAAWKGIKWGGSKIGDALGWAGRSTGLLSKVDDAGKVIKPGMLSKAGTGLGKLAGKAALPLMLITGAYDIITDMIKGWKEDGLKGGLAQVFGGDKEGGFASAFKGMGKYAVIGAGIGSVVPVVGTMAGGLIGGAIGGIVGFLGRDRLSKIGDFISKWTGGDFIADLFPGEYGKKFSSAAGWIPLIGPIAGGVIGTIVDSWVFIFDKMRQAGDWISEMVGVEKLSGLFPGQYGKLFAEKMDWLPLVGPIGGGLVGSIIDGWAGIFSLVGRAGDWIADMTSAETLSGLFPGPLGKEFSLKMGFLPLIGPLAGGMIGTMIDGLTNIFSGDPIGAIKKKITDMLPDWTKNLLGIDEPAGGTAAGAGAPGGAAGKSAPAPIPDVIPQQKKSTWGKIKGWFTKDDVSYTPSGGLIWPGSNYITSPFGPRKVSLRGASAQHRGVDMRAGDVAAAADGVVVDINNRWGGVTIRHADGMSTRYLHMDTISVKKGDAVTAGQKIGVAGSRGPIRGMKKHLHFEVMHKGRKLDPEMVYNSAGKFAPSYAPDIIPARQLQAKLGGTKIDPKQLKAEGAESAGPFGYDMYDPIAILGSLEQKIDNIQKEEKRKTDLDTYSRPQAPLFVPVSSGEGANPDQDRLNQAKKETAIDPELDSFVNGLFSDSSFEFGQRYKKYAYHSNVGHLFT